MSILPCFYLLTIVTLVYSSPISSTYDSTKSNLTAYCHPDPESEIPWTANTDGTVWYTFTPTETQGTWWQMEAYCRTAEFGRSGMASIRTKAEHDFIAALVGGKPGAGMAWVGGARFAKDKFFWYANTKHKISLQKFRYQAWYSGEPDGDDCVALDYSGCRRMHDVNCDNVYPVICELRC